MGAARRLLGVARSAAWIAAIQAVNFLVPLAALPFIVRGLGVEQFSVYAVLMACATSWSSSPTSPST